MNSLLLTEFFGAIKEIASLVPNFSEKRKKELDEETRILFDLGKKFNNAAVEFKPGSRSDELLGLADDVNSQEKALRDLYVIYAKELRGN